MTLIKTLIVLALVACAGCSGQDTPDEQATPSAPPAASSTELAPVEPTATSTDTQGPTDTTTDEATDTQPPRQKRPIVRFGERGVLVESAADARELRGTPMDFRRFVVTSAERIKRPPGTKCDHGLTINAFDPAGFAVGSVSECGGYVAVWGRKNGRWKELIGTQDAFTCDELAKVGVPAGGIIKTCIGGPKPMKEISYTG